MLLNHEYWCEPECTWQTNSINKTATSERLDSWASRLWRGIGLVFKSLDCFTVWPNFSTRPITRIQSFFFFWWGCSAPIHLLFGAVNNEYFKFLNTLRTKYKGFHFTDDILKWIFVNENVWIAINISLKRDTESRISKFLALVEIKAWRRTGDNPLSDPMMFSLLTHICVTLSQWVNILVYHKI